MPTDTCVVLTGWGLVFPAGVPADHIPHSLPSRRRRVSMAEFASHSVPAPRSPFRTSACRRAPRRRDVQRAAHVGIHTKHPQISTSRRKRFLVRVTRVLCHCVVSVSVSVGVGVSVSVSGVLFCLRGVARSLHTLGFPSAPCLRERLGQLVPLTRRTRHYPVLCALQDSVQRLGSLPARNLRT